MTKHDSITVTALKRSTLFHKVPPSTLDRLSTNAITMELRRGERLAAYGVRGTGVYVAATGCLMLGVGTPGSGKVIELVSAGGHTGLAAAVLGVADPVTAQALVDSALVLIPRATLLQCATESPQLALQLAAALSKQVQGLIADIEAFSLRSGRERVADYLQQLVGANGTRAQPFALPAKKSIIASRLNLTPEYFSRALRDLTTTGAISVSGREITVLDSARLKQLGA